MIETILPRKGLIAIWGMDLVNRGPQQKHPQAVWLDTVALTEDAISQAINTVTESGASDIYFTIASFEFKAGQPKRRRAPFAKLVRSYGIDLDAHGGPGEYPTPDAAYTHLLEVCSTLGLPPTVVVHTGRGIQAFWTVDQDMGIKEWQTLSEIFYSLLVAHDIKLDRSVQGDRARVFRLPGTINSRAGIPSRVLKTGSTYEKRNLMRRLKKVCDEAGIIPAPTPIDLAPRAVVAPSMATVYQCRDNERRLEALATKLPEIYDDDPARNKSGYELWRDTIWAIKRTGLANSWQVGLDYARRSESSYDDWFESYQRTWDSDKGRSFGDITAGTLIWLARHYGRGMDRGKFSRLRFLTEEDVEDTKVIHTLLHNTGAYSRTGEFEETDIEPADPAIEEAVAERKPEGEKPAENAPSLSGLRNQYWDGEVADQTWLNGGAYTEVVPVIFPPDDISAGMGGPGSKLPPGLKWDKQGRGCLHKKPKDSDEPDDFDEEAGCDPVVDAPIEYLGREQNRTTIEGAKSQGFDILRVYDITGHWQILQVPMCDMENPQELLKLVKGHGGEICARGQKGAKLVSYVNALSRAYRKDHGRNSAIVQQAGWFSPNEEDEDRNPVAFLLGKKIITRSGMKVYAKLDAGAEASNTYFGDQRGTLEGQKRILAAYNENSEGAMVSKVFCSWALGTILGQFLPQKQAVPYLYSNKGGRGKTAMVAVAFSLWGNGTYLTLSPNSTKAAFMQYPSRRGCLPTFMDDVTRGGRFSMEEYKNIILTSTQRVEGAASNSTGRGLIRGTLKLKGAIAMSGNIPTNDMLDDKGPSVEASYRRLCLMRWKVMPAYDDGIPLSRRPARPKVDGMDIDQATLAHFGHIGPMFVQWVLDNFSMVRDEINQQYQRLLDKAYTDPSGRGTHMTFICATAACARVGAIWMHKYGIVPGWDIEALLDRIDTMGEDTRAEVDNLYSMDPNNLWNRILEEAQGRTIDVPESGRVLQQDVSPAMMIRGGPLIRLDRAAGKAYMSMNHVRKVVAENSCDWRDTDMWIKQNYSEAPQMVILGKDIPGALYTRTRCYVIPLEKIAGDLGANKPDEGGAQDALAKGPPRAASPITG